MAVGKKFRGHIAACFMCTDSTEIIAFVCACNRKVGIMESALNSTDLHFLISFQTHIFSHVMGTKYTFLRSISIIWDRHFACVCYCANTIEPCSAKI